MTEHSEKAIRRTVYSLISFLLAIIIALIAMSAIMYNAANTLSGQARDLKDIMSIVDRDLVTSWNINATQKEYTIGEGLGITLRGDFECTPETIEVDPWITFQASLRPQDPETSPFINIPVGSALQANSMCEKGSVDFTISWDNIGNDILHIKSPAIYHIDYAANTDIGWKSAHTTTNDFIVINPVK